MLNLIQQLASLPAFSAPGNPIAGGLGGFGGGGGIQQFLGSIFGGFKARGGSVQAGKAYVVGEKRPELFVPGSNGRIEPTVPELSVPAKARARSGGRSGPVISATYQIDARGSQMTEAQFRSIVQQENVKLGREIRSKVTGWVQDDHERYVS